ncbi:probable protein phosphatase 2C 78 [Cornus florida]|uniref:probable protein phosphatase 2C 78 n=1 Tax=Cornus florida TaxID=4283 RepID=UPI002899B79F|nr:probable protein phosphatase 2C 78 [Cornus florida]
MEQGKATLQDLDLRCEELIQEEFGECCNFDVDDSVQKLEKFGIVARGDNYKRRQVLTGENYISKFGFTSVCGRSREMEDAVAVYPSLSMREDGLHYFGVYDGHGCSHVAVKCMDRLHGLVKEELESSEGLTDWESAMERSFFRMDREVAELDGDGNCPCELRMPVYEAVGSTAVVSMVSPDKIVVANCGDSRAVLFRKGKAVPLSVDHKPDRSDELSRIQAAGGQVITWDCPRVLGVLNTSRAIGDDYLKPYVICQPEVTVIDRTAGDEFLILASKGLWEVVTNEKARRLARTCLRGRAAATAESNSLYWPEIGFGQENSDRACFCASALLTSLALARHTSNNVSVVVINLRT